MTAVRSVMQRLVDEGLGIMDQTIFIAPGVPLPGPNETRPIITVQDTGGAAPIGIHNPGVGGIHQASYQIVARGFTYTPVEVLIWQAWNALGLRNAVIGSVFWLNLGPASDPFPLPNDSTNRLRLVFNVNGKYR